MTNARDKVAVVAVGALCYVVSLIYTGYDAVASNRSVSLALVELLREPSLYPTDPIRETLPRYISALWWIVAWLSRYFPLEPLEFALFLATRILLFVAVYRLAWAVVPKNTLAVFSSMVAFALMPQPMFAQGTIMVSILEQSSMAVPFVLLSLADLLEKRYWRSALWLGIVANLTVLYAVYIGVCLLLVALAIDELRREWKRWMLAAGFALVVATPVLLLTLAHRYVSPADVDLWYQVNRFRSPFHVYPLAFGRVAWTYFLLFCGLVGLTGWLVGQSRQIFGRLCYTWLGAVAVLVVGAMLTAYVLKVPVLTSLQLAKGVDLLFAVGAVLTVVGATVWLQEALTSGSFWWTVGAAVLWSAGVSLWSYDAHPKLSWLLVGLAMFGVLAYRLSGWGRQTVFAAVLVVLLSLSAARQWQVGGVSFRFAAHSPQHPFAQWAQQNTPKEAVFMVPPGKQEDWQSFRAMSRRGVFVTWKDGTHVLFDPRYTEEWVNRIAEIGFDIRRHHLGLRGRSPVDWSNINDLYFRLRDADIQRIASRYGVDYWVVPVEKESSFPEVFRHGKWKVLQVTDTSGRREITPTSQPKRDNHR